MNGINHGGLLTPETTLLSEYAINTATQDYFFTTGSSQLKLKGLDSEFGYIFSFFGTRNTTSTRTSSYTVTGTNTFTGNLQTSGTDLGGSGYNGNNSTVLVSDTLFADTNGELTLDVAVVEGGFAYLGLMKVTQIEIPSNNDIVFIDFGPNDGTNGNLTPSPDANGNYWNNLNTPAAGSDSVSLVTTSNQPTSAFIKVGSTFQMNGINHGGLLAPEESLLSEFAINTATQDYFFTTGSSTLEFFGLHDSKGYIFSFFGTRNTSSTRITEYKVTGSNIATDSLQTSGTDLGGSGYNGNNSTVVTTDTLIADSNGKLTLDVSVVEGGFAYLGFLKIELVDVETSPVNTAPVASAGNDQLLDAGTTVAILTGSGTDVDDDPLTYLWVQVSGPEVSISDSTTATTNISGLSDGTTYEFELTVSDELLNDSDRVTITVKAPAVLDTIPSFFVDFGPNDGNNGNSTSNPDLNDNYWNNINTPAAGGDTLWLVDEANLQLDKYLLVKETFQMNGINHGGLLSPENSLLGEFAIATATQDYFFTTGSSSLELGGLAADKGYIFSLFGTRNTSSTRVTEYSIIGANTFVGNHQTSGTDLGGTGYNGNNSTVLVTDTLYADTEGKLQLDVSVVEGGFAYLGLMKVDMVDVEPLAPNTAPIADAGEDQLLDSGTTSYQLDGSATDAEDDPLTYEWTQIAGPSAVIVDSSLANSTIDGLSDGNTYTFELTVSDGLLFDTDQVTISVEAEPLVIIDDDLYRSFYVDFGPDDVTNGNITASPDVNGNHWNNPTNSSSTGTPIDLVDSENVASNLQVRVISDLSKNGIQNGGLLAPEFEELGDFAVATATQDYFFTTSSGSIELRGLNLNRAYVFNIFASRNTENVRKTEYRIAGSNIVVDTLQSSGPDIGGDGYNGNNSEILTTKPVRPDANGRITLRLSAIEGGFGYINTLRVDEVNAANQFLVDFGPNDGTNGNSTESPDFYNNTWNNMNDPVMGGDSLKLASKVDESSDIYLKVTRAFQSNGILNGGLLDPDQELLGEFAVGTATEDYFFTTDTSSIEIGGLDSENGYVFHLFGTRNSSSDRVTEYALSGNTTVVDTLITSGVDIGGAGYNGNNSSIVVTDTLMANDEGKIHLDVIVKSGGFAYLGFMKIDEVEPPAEPEPICPVRNDNLIAIMGSSVAFGVGATNNQGYAYMLEQELQSRFNDGLGAEWDMTNISIGGNTTLNLLARYETDLLPTCGEYVVYGLSLGNEGIKGGGQPIWDQFADNMVELAEIAVENGFTPIIANNYTRSDYTATEYEFIKEMNIFLNSLPYPNINLLGAIDDGTGKWASGYIADAFHPNTAGHREFFYSIVPSLFDALDAGKPTPVLNNTEFTTINSANDAALITYVPDGTVHPFTISFEVQTNSSGIVSEFNTDQGTGYVMIDEETGHIGYISAANDTVYAERIVNDGDWHTITLSHYYAWGRTFIYVDSTKSSSVTESLELGDIILGGSVEGGMPETANYRNFMFHRSALNEDEVEVYAGGSVIQASLELFAPLSEGEVSAGIMYENIAQSTTYASSNITVDSETENGLDIPERFNLYQNYPNPFNPSTNIQFDIPFNSDVKIEVFNLLGAKVSTVIDQQLNAGSYVVNFDASALSSGVYFYRIQAGQFQSVQKMLLMK